LAVAKTSGCSPRPSSTAKAVELDRATPMQDRATPMQDRATPTQDRATPTQDSVTMLQSRHLPELVLLVACCVVAEVPFFKHGSTS